MRSLPRFLGACGLALMMSAGAGQVLATCTLPGSGFVSNYFDAPIGQSVAEAAGSFWGLGQFNPASPGGTDNGLIGPGDAVEPWLGYTPGVGFYVFGDWASNLYDGCIQDPPNPQPARMAVTFSTSNGVDSYFVALCASESIFGDFYHLLEIPSQPMTRTPKPVIHSQTGPTTNRHLIIGIEAFTGGVYNFECNLAVTGFRVYQRTVPRNAPLPPGRIPGGDWVFLGQGSSGADAEGQVSCETDGDIYLMATLVVDGNVETQYGSRVATKVECGPNLATPNGEGDFIFIRKPKLGRGR